MITPQINNSLEPTTETITIPSKTYKLTDDRIAGYVDNLEAIKQAVYHILNVERYSCLIYDDNYGVELEQYIGKDFSYLEVTIEDTLREALYQDERIVDVTVNSIEKINKDSVHIIFTVTSIYGDVQMEVDIDV